MARGGGGTRGGPTHQPWTTWSNGRSPELELQPRFRRNVCNRGSNRSYGATTVTSPTGREVLVSFFICLRTPRRARTRRRRGRAAARRSAFGLLPFRRPYLGTDVGWFLVAGAASAISAFVFRPQLAKLADRPDQRVGRPAADRGADCCSPSSSSTSSRSRSTWVCTAPPRCGTSTRSTTRAAARRTRDHPIAHARELHPVRHAASRPLPDRNAGRSRWWRRSRSTPRTPCSTTATSASTSVGPKPSSSRRASIGAITSRARRRPTSGRSSRSGTACSAGSSDRGHDPRRAVRCPRRNRLLPPALRPAVREPFVQIRQLRERRVGAGRPAGRSASSRRALRSSPSA